MLNILRERKRKKFHNKMMFLNPYIPLPKKKKKK